MQIYILRHGIADPPRPGQPDADRALTPEGRVKLDRVLRRARGAGANLSLILSSPYRRAVETAEIAADLLSYKGKIVKTSALTPSASPYDAWEEIRTRPTESAILVAGHEPLFSTLVAFLLDSPGLVVDMKKGALVRVDCEHFGTEPACTLKWMLTAALAGE